MNSASATAPAYLLGASITGTAGIPAQSVSKAFRKTMATEASDHKYRWPYVSRGRCICKPHRRVSDTIQFTENLTKTHGLIVSKAALNISPCTSRGSTRRGHEGASVSEATPQFRMVLARAWALRIVSSLLKRHGTGRRGFRRRLEHCVCIEHNGNPTTSVGTMETYFQDTGK